MDVNQLIKALGDAAAAAKPAQEYCLLGFDSWATCMTKAEWSGWMQALGAVVAIWWSGRLASKQIRAAREQAAHQIEAAGTQAASQIKAAREQALTGHMEARKLVADQRRLDDLLKTEVLYALFHDSLAYCQRIHDTHVNQGVPTVQRSQYEQLKELGQVLRQLPAFELPGQPLAVLTVRLATNIEAVCELGLGLKLKTEGTSYLETVDRLRDTLQETTLLLEESIRLCEEQIENLSVLSTGVRVS